MAIPLTLWWTCPYKTRNPSLPIISMIYMSVGSWLPPTLLLPRPDKPNRQISIGSTKPLQLVTRYCLIQSILKCWKTYVLESFLRHLKDHIQSHRSLTTMSMPWTCHQAVTNTTNFMWVCLGLLLKNLPCMHLLQSHLLSNITLTSMS